MQTVFAAHALLPHGWAENVLIAIDRDGWIVDVDAGRAEPSDKSCHVIAGPLICGMPNAHSHVFQRAMAGLAERGTGHKRSFWNWRETMYRFLADLTPDDMFALTEMTYMDMLKGGYTSVCEFHYVHHDPAGTPYDTLAEMSHQIIRAALGVGIAITHMPALYACNGLDHQPPTQGQRRFLSTPDMLVRMLEDLQKEYAPVPQVTLGIAPHSLRAVSQEMLADYARAAQKICPGLPAHILVGAYYHEVEQAKSFLGQTPGSFLLHQDYVDQNWTFVHGSFLNDADLRAMAARGVTACLCPSSDANQGVRLLSVLDLLQYGGRFAIGSASHMILNPMEELRLLEYAQRVKYSTRVMLHTDDIPSVGAALFEKTVAGGAHSSGRKTGKIAPGFRADMIVLDDTLPIMTGRLRDHVLDTAIFASNQNPVRDVMSGGRWVIQNRKHRREKQITDKYRKVVEKL